MGKNKFPDVVESLVQHLAPDKMREAYNWAKDACNVVRHAAEPNPYRNYTDDEIAQLILNRLKTEGKIPNAKNP